MIRFIKSLFAWRAIRDTGVYRYFENDVTGDRKAVWLGGCYQPVDIDLLVTARGRGSVAGPRGLTVLKSREGDQ